MSLMSSASAAPSLLLFSGKDDQLWPSDLFAERVVQRLGAHHFKHPVQVPSARRLTPAAVRIIPESAGARRADGRLQHARQGPGRAAFRPRR